MGTLQRIACAIVAIAAMGCGNGSQDRPAATQQQPAVEPSDRATEPMMVEGYQIVRVIVRNTGYEPAMIQLHAGKPTKIIFVQEGDSDCASQIQIPQLGVPVTDLPQGKETIVDFTPHEIGSYEFTCGMSMLRGTILVTS